ncbi:MAG: galactokinase [Deltaproteobacteria bacterium]|nr:MAG: galactokinase [Deltaproteobacteria bacterium]
MNNLDEILDKKGVGASAPCRIDFAGTLDIPTFSFPMADLCPVTFNMALDLRTNVKIKPYRKNFIKVVSKGFDDAEFEVKKAPYNHPLGLVFAIADSFDISGVEIIIKSDSPPQSALGGSSTASVALTALIMRILQDSGSKVSAKDAAFSAYCIESAVAGVPCGFQDHLSAAYGGANAWHWSHVLKWPEFGNTTLLEKEDYREMENNFLVLYTGKTHNSYSVNNKWREQFLSGNFRKHWIRISELSQFFCNLFLVKDFEALAEIIKEEVALRMEMTPEVLDDKSRFLVEKASSFGCGARFTGSGGGGCIWAMGEKENIQKLRACWKEEVLKIENAILLDTKPDPYGILFEDIN